MIHKSGVYKFTKKMSILLQIVQIYTLERTKPNQSFIYPNNSVYHFSFLYLFYLIGILLNEIREYSLSKLIM